MYRGSKRFRERRRERVLGFGVTLVFDSFRGFGFGFFFSLEGF